MNSIREVFHSLANRSVVVLAMLVLAASAAYAADYVASAKTYIAQDKLRTAVIELKNALQADPDNVEARVLLGTTYLRAGDPVSAEKELRRAGELGASRDQWLIPLSQALLWRNQPDDVLDQVKVEQGDSNALKLDIHAARANAGLEKNDLALVKEEFEKAKGIDAANAKVLLLDAHLTRQAGDADKAAELVQQAIDADPEYLEAYLVKGRWLYFQGKFDEAIATYQRAIQINPHNPNVRTAKAAAHLASRQLDAAAKELDAMGPLADRLVLTRYMRSLITLGRGNAEEAENQLREVLRSAPDFPPAHLLLGAVSYQRGQLETSEAHLARYVSIDPSNLRAAKLLAVVRLKLGNTDGALQLLEPRIPIAKEDPQFLAILGTAYMKKNDFAKGSDYLNQAAALAPNAAAIRTQLGISQLGAGDAGKATEELQTAVQLDPDMLQADLLLVLVHMREGQYDQAVEAAQQMVKRHPNDPLSYNVIGAAYLGKGEKQDAKKYFLKALEVDPKFIAARVNLARLAQMDGDEAGARKHLEEALTQEPGNLRVLLALAQLAERSGDAQLLRKRLEQARDANPKAIEPRVLLARLELTRNEPLKALATARELANDHPRHPVVLRTLGQVQLAAGETASAAVTFERLVAVESRSEEARYLLADARMKNGDLSGAASALNEALQLNAKHVPSLAMQVALYVKQNKPEKALEAAQALQKYYPDAGIGYQLEGGVELQQKRYKQAAESLSQAYSRTPNSDVALALFRARVALDKNQEAKSGLKDWLDKRPDDIRSRSVLASQLQAEGSVKEATEQYEKIRSADPGNVVAWNNLAWLYSEQGDARALPYAEQAYKLDSERPEVIDTYGWMMVQAGELKKGLEKLQTASSRAPHLPSIQYHKAVAMQKNGDIAGARKELQRLLDSQRAFPERKSAEQLLKSLSNSH